MWLVTYEGGRPIPPEDGHIFKYQRTDCEAAGIELSTFESQVRRHTETLWWPG